MPKLAAFPKAFMDSLCVDATMTILEWIDLASTLDIDGLEFYTGFLELQDHAAWSAARKVAGDYGLVIPMLCASPDFTHPDATFRKQQVELQKRWIDGCAELGGQFCRVLSGQRRPEVSRADGLDYAVDSIQECMPHAAACGVTLILENHYKDNYWEYPEFAQHMDVFCALIERIDSPWFGVNYDPSNTLLAGEDPLELLRRIKHRVLTVHASDRYLAEGTLEELRREENSLGYAERLRHGVIGSGLNDYDAIFRELSEIGFDSWISIEDGVEGIEQLRESVKFLREKMSHFWIT